MAKFVFSFIVCNIVLVLITVLPDDMIAWAGTALSLDELYAYWLPVNATDEKSVSIFEANRVAFYRTAFVFVYGFIVSVGAYWYVARYLPTTTRLQIANDVLQFFVSHGGKIAEIENSITAAAAAVPGSDQHNASIEKVKKLAAEVRHLALGHLVKILETRFKMTEGSAGIIEQTKLNKDRLTRTHPLPGDGAEFDISPNNKTPWGRGFAYRCWQKQLQATTGYAYMMRRPLRIANPYCLMTAQIENKADDRNHFFVCCWVQYVAGSATSHAVICFDFPKKGAFPQSTKGLKDVAQLLSELLIFTLKHHLNADDRKV
jgi:hypothetical protein